MIESFEPHPIGLELTKKSGHREMIERFELAYWEVGNLLTQRGVK